MQMNKPREFWISKTEHQNYIFTEPCDECIHVREVLQSCPVCNEESECRVCGHNPPSADVIFSADSYWNEKHGDTRNFDYSRDDIENAFKAGHASRDADVGKLQKEKDFLVAHIDNQFPCNKITSIRVIEDHSQIFQIRHSLAEKEITRLKDALIEAQKHCEKGMPIPALRAIDKALENK